MTHKHQAALDILQRELGTVDAEMAKYEKYTSLRTRSDRLKSSIRLLEDDDPSFKDRELKKVVSALRGGD